MRISLFEDESSCFYSKNTHSVFEKVCTRQKDMKPKVKSSEIPSPGDTATLYFAIYLFILPIFL